MTEPGDLLPRPHFRRHSRQIDMSSQSIPSTPKRAPYSLSRILAARLDNSRKARIQHRRGTAAVGDDGIHSWQPAPSMRRGGQRVPQVFDDDAEQLGDAPGLGETSAWLVRRIAVDLG